MKMAIISDTHNVLRPEIREIISDSDAVIHGGDISTQKVLDSIKNAVKPNVPFFVVRGNNDKEWAENIPESLQFEFGGLRFFLVHNKKDIPKNINADIVVFGHSHKYYEECINGKLWLNPGSCGRRRFNLPVTMAVMNITDSGYTVERIEISDKKMIIHESDLLKNIRSIMKYMDNGMSIDRISKRLKLDSEFVEQIARICVTHPGVDAEGILNKIEINQIASRDAQK